MLLTHIFLIALFLISIGVGRAVFVFDVFLAGKLARASAAAATACVFRLLRRRRLVDFFLDCLALLEVRKLK